MDYYTELKPKVDAALRPLAEDRDRLRKEVAALRTKIGDTQAYISRVEKHVIELEGLAGEALVGGQNEYAKFQTTLRNRTQELADKRHEVAALEKALAQQQEALIISERAFENGVTIACRELRGLCEDAMHNSLDQIVTDHDGWFFAWERICANYGTSFSRTKRDHVPLPAHPRFNHRRFGCVEVLSTEERMERVKESQAESVPASIPATP